MPDYSIKITVNNQSAAKSLRRVDLYACEGDYTDGWGVPPTIIAPRQSVAFQPESTSGPVSGSKGYVKYEVGYIRSDNSILSNGFMCLYWSVPVLGNSTFTVNIAHLAIGCDCDGKITNDQDESQFPLPLAFGAGWNHENGVPNDGHGHDNVDVSVLDVAGPGLGPYHYGPFNQPSVNDWVGHWAQSGVDIVIAKVSGDTCTITLADSTASPSISVAETIDLSTSTGTVVVQSEVVNTDLGAAEVHGFRASTTTSTSLGTAAEVKPQSSETPVNSFYEMPLKDTSTISSSTITRPVPIREPIPAPTGTSTVEVPLKDTSAASASTITRPATIPLVVHNVLYLQNGVVLTLMRAVDSAGTAQGVSIRYQLISPLRVVSRDLEIGKYAAPPR